MAQIQWTVTSSVVGSELHLGPADPASVAMGMDADYAQKNPHRMVWVRPYIPGELTGSPDETAPPSGEVKVYRLIAGHSSLMRVAHNPAQQSELDSLIAVLQAAAIEAVNAPLMEMVDDEDDDQHRSN